MTKRPARPTRADLTPNDPRVATYLRISTDEDHQPFSLDAQRQRLDAFIASQPGWTHVRTYTDQMSGAYAERPGLDEALRDARFGAYDILLVYRVDRFARSLKVLVSLLEDLEDAGVAFRSATEPIDTGNPTGRMLVQLLGVFAEFERATIIDRVIAGMERKAARGHWPGGRLPFGLAIDADKHLIANPDQLPLVQAVFERYTKERAGAERIAADLNANGLRTRSGRPFSRQVILGILRNRSYLGEVTFRGAVHQSSPEPFVDPILFAQAEALLTERGEGYENRFEGRHPPYLFSSRITCGVCTRRYIGAASSGQRHRYRYYMCWTRNRYGAGSCDSTRLRADDVEARVFEDILERYSKTDLLLHATQAQRGQLAQQLTQRRGELRAIKSEIAATETAIERYMDAFERGTLPEEAFGDRVRELGLKAKALRARQAELQQLPHPGDDTELTLAALELMYRYLKRIIEHAPDDIRKNVAQALVHDLHVDDPTHITPTYRIIAPPPGSWPQNPLDGDDETSVRAMTSLVGVEGLEPPTTAL
jgi:site-specific DNA recombinase